MLLFLVLFCKSFVPVCLGSLLGVWNLINIVTSQWKSFQYGSFLDLEPAYQGILSNIIWEALPRVYDSLLSFSSSGSY